MTPPRVLILHANGTNRDQELADAFTQAGAKPEIVHLTHLRANKKNWHDYQILAIPGGFSYGDTLGAGRLLALDLKIYFADEVQHFIESGKPVIGICNGFQALVKAGLLPGLTYQNNKTENLTGTESQPATLTFNHSGQFECRWITLRPQSKQCLWTRDLVEPIYCPVAHGEGRFTLANPELLTQLKNQDQLAFCYTNATGELAHGEYPFNPNGSIADIAGICNPQGNVLGLMPHPEDHIFYYQHPRWTRGEQGLLGLPLFVNGVKFIK